jgi:hypothetical protein
MRWVPNSSMRLTWSSALWLRKRHRRSRHFGRWALLNFTPNEFGLVSLYGIVVQPRAGKPWRDKPNAGGERRR